MQNKRVTLRPFVAPKEDVAMAMGQRMGNGFGSGIWPGAPHKPQPGGITQGVCDIFMASNIYFIRRVTEKYKGVQAKVWN